VIVFFVVVSYDVLLLFTTGSPMRISTPCGTDSGVRPSLLARVAVAENVRLELPFVVAALRKGEEVAAGVIARHRALPLRPVADNAAIVAARVLSRLLRWGFPIRRVP
jgi:hypothetical protein